MKLSLTRLQQWTRTGQRPGIIGALVVCPAVASVYMTAVTFPDVGQSFGVGASGARASFFVASFSYALAFFVFGPLSDALDARLLAAGGALAVLALVTLATLVGSYPLFLLLLALAGIAAAAVPAAMFALLPRIAPEGSTGVYFGMLIGASVAGIALGRSLTAVLAGWAGWHRGFLIMGALNLVSLALLPLIQREPSRDRARGALLRKYRATALLFVDAAVVRMLMIGVLVFFGYLGVMTFLTLRLQDPPFRYDSTALGAINLLGVVGVFGAPLAGSLINRIGAPRVVLGALGTILLGLLALAFAQSTPLVAAGVLLVFLGVFCCQPAVLFMLARRVAVEQRGGASSIYLLCSLCAGSAATGALGPVWNGGGWTAVIGIGIGVVVIAVLLVSPLASRAAGLGRVRVARGS